MSLRFVLFDLGLFAPEDDQDQARRDLCWLLESLTQRNQSYLREHPDVPSLYSSGIRYARPAQVDRGAVPEIAILQDALDRRKAVRPEVQQAMEMAADVLGGERFRDWPRAVEAGAVDCDNLACMRAAELRNAGIWASPYVTSRKRPDGGTTMHAIVRHPDGTAEDSSLLLGMGGTEKAADRTEEHRRNNERRAKLATAIRAAVESGRLSQSEGAEAIRKLVALFPIEMVVP
jgi:hypothetical protein